jgi:hypothetical protein
MTVLASTMMPLPVAALASVLFRAVSILAEVLAATVSLAWVGSTDRAAPASADASLHTCSALASAQGGAVGTPSCACGRAS